MARIAVVGSINMDLVTRTPRRPRPGETVLGTAFDTVPGGKGANQAIAARRAGAAVDFVGAVGTDVFGVELRKVLEDNEIGTAGLRTVEGASGTATIVVDDAGENTIIVVGGANAELSGLTDGDRALVAEADILLCQLEIPVETVLGAARCAREHGTLVLLNPSPARSLPPQLWEAVDIAVVNEGEAAQLDSELRAVPHVLTTRGGEGARYRGPEGELSHPGVRVEVVDTTGAGDAFTGALAAHWHEGPATALAWACTAGALATTVVGATAAIPTAAAIERALTSRCGER
ncbi:MULTISPECIES: ribokinase [Nocardia]|uniref:ribokinase n=1 Tax=Nocardia TaxID=1817 RepID=UPI0007E988A5|nr:MULTISPECIES: ribokinase [Nocardia]MBF6273492.1 ribokinase [Nocardia nova]OBA50300.1 ribokinase [Nocardia sp. 852002-51101_SCH5132738]OBB48759.1 ribokinase [Nocardia sp. 852002-51244_SCH5132740]OBF75305.1 ribokinase [Mycobacterium sp. 852002-51759_SCH5129042]